MWYTKEIQAVFMIIIVKFVKFLTVPIAQNITHTQTDFETAPEKRLQYREIIHQIQNEALQNCFAFRTSIEMNFKTVFSDLDNLNSEMLTNIEKLTGCLHKVLHNFRLEHRCLKQKIEMKKCIASTYIYEHVNEHSSDAPIKFFYP